MSEYVDISVIKNTAIIALNRPKALNALNFEMIKAIDNALNDFENDTNINGILLKSAHERGFCAGGDIRDIRQHALDRKRGKMEEYFSAEYIVDGKIAKYKKPIVVLSDGLVMGGGLGLAGHAKYRITTKTTRFAMPESAIGFVCDCAIDAILAKIERFLALAFLMSGEIVGAGDALALNLVDCVINKNSLEEVEENIIDIFSKIDIDEELKQLLKAKNISEIEQPFIKKSTICKTAFEKNNFIEIVNSLKELSENNLEAKYFYDNLNKLCPTSLAAIVFSYDEARKAGDVIRSLEIDLKMVLFMASRSDFIEGVRAVIIDKDRKPKWKPNELNKVNIDEIHSKIL